MQIKDMKRSEWNRITKRRVIIRPFAHKGFHGKVSLLKILEVTSPFVSSSGSASVTLADAGYSWLQLAMENDFVWFTVMFDDQDRFLQIYIDVTDGNHTDCEDPWFADLYLDYVIDEDRIIKLDADELQQAHMQKQITLQQFVKTLQHGEMIERYLSSHHHELIAFFNDLQKKLSAAMNRTD